MTQVEHVKGFDNAADRAYAQLRQGAEGNEVKIAALTTKLDNVLHTSGVDRAGCFVAIASICAQQALDAMPGIENDPAEIAVGSAGAFMAGLSRLAMDIATLEHATRVGRLDLRSLLGDEAQG